MSPKSTRDDPSYDPAPVGDEVRNEPDVAAFAPIDPPKPGDIIANPAEPLAPTVVPEKTDPSVFLNPEAAHEGYPKTLYHPVHGAIELTDPNMESQLQDRRSWFHLPELADAARTWTEAHITAAANTAAKLASHAEAGHAVVRNSVQADLAVRAGRPEPL
jgi:hypothetical protein